MPEQNEQKLVTLKINDRDVQVPPGTLGDRGHAAHRYRSAFVLLLPGLSLQAACRMCLVEVEKMPKLQTACTLVATEGHGGENEFRPGPQRAQIHAGIPVDQSTRWIARCATRAASVNCRTWLFRYGADTSRFVEEKIHRPEEKVVGVGLLRCSALHSLLPLRARFATKAWTVKALGRHARRPTA